ncbi:PREDICTED: kynurenine--oxoglutarate transaminase 3-like [Amphimedon queenslandica]|uniref:Aminotransferase class I/classII large domain-containing protein n=1 Tax=Amphimedon queenslandica TaxID=400682 RepID=A0A1X7TYI9_AMPQE|nr:PREDICTED: kynurenine--oxoglutarate transaminase 3-like [Amphimedon queenslandica]|eukprot:XP_019856948.1 PREDICTED: kynurenine--oxoglutarate transaminase 3-like [Amphimedon queenslandica]
MIVSRGLSASLFRHRLLLSKRNIVTSVGAMASTGKNKTAERTKGFETNLWVEYAALAIESKAINLGQGFPDFSPPQFVIDALVESSKTTMLHQYTRGPGHPRLVKALAAMYSKLYGREINPMTEVVTAVGAYTSLYQSIQGHVNEGDEVILVEPFFDCYNPMVCMAGGKPVFVPLRPSASADKGEGRYPLTSSGWALDMDELKSAFSPKTKAIIINNPNNPTGKVFTRSELGAIAELCISNDVICISDEVYEWLIYPGKEHVRIATLPGMWERTITVGSAGKTFSATGWKLGWSVGPAPLIKNMMTINSNTAYTNPTPIQEAVAIGIETEMARLGEEGSYFKELPSLLLKKRDRMIQVLKEVGLTPIVPEGGYFLLADTANLGIKFDESTGSEPYDVQFAKWMTKEKRIAAIPPSYFFSPEHRYISDGLIRFCFCKEDSTLEAAYDAFRKWAAERRN